MLEAVKLAMGITSAAYDAELLDLIQAAQQDLRVSGIRADVGDALIRRAVITYCRCHFGSPADFDRLTASYESQKTLLWAASGYTDWGECGC